ncbi:NAD-dependent epimerase/dehydratase family protein [Duganella sp. FT50W]|uniref:NAD-dependent epimerase/dehydratase family protein n=1 Tax=Duganella lactea TaxID=2692173 RepID=A0A6L8MTR2_9BURK|nr:NAD-dependent epimerase/dehydratase family protein [Duganella lactea]MYM85379.1 NAD-dependent epimerase/dehydratase family protein [Duganella lactea]
MTVAALDDNAIVAADLQQIADAALPWQLLRGRTLLVTGGAGFLAAYLVKALLTANQRHQLGLRVICVTRRAASAALRLSGCLGRDDFGLYEHDIGQPPPPDFPAADVLVHAASQASPKYYGVDPVGTLLANAAGTQHLLTHARACGAQRFLFFSSGEVYGVPPRPQQPVTETDYGYLDPMNVRACYGESKRMGEAMCAAWAAQYGLHASVVRPFHTYGPGMAPDDGRVFADFVADVVAGRQIVLHSDGAALRPFCYIADATIGFLTVLLQGASGQAYNVGNPHAEIAIRDLAALLAALYPERCPGVRFQPQRDPQAYLKSPIARSCPDIAKIAALGWQPRTGLADGFRRTIASYL